MKKLLSSRTHAITILFAFVVLVSLACVSSCSGALLDEVKKDVQEEKDKIALEKQNKKRTETTKPVISVLAWQTITDAKSNSPTAAFNVTAEAKAISAKSTATIAGYLCKEESTAPALDSTLWAAAAPSSFTFTVMTDSSLNGTHTLYVWVKDSFGNISDASSLELTLEPLAASWAAPYVNGVTVTAHERFSLAAIENLSTTDASVTGTLGVGSVALSGTGNRTVTVSPGATGTGLWTAGSQTLTLSVKTELGLTLTKTLSLTAFNGVCVSLTGNDANDGTARLPLRNISTGPAKAQTLYPAGGAIHVAEGEYSASWQSSTNRITMTEGYSLYGGYKSDWTARNVQSNKSIIRDASSSGGTASNPNRAVDIPSGISLSTFLDGLYIYGGLGDYSAAIFCQGSPTIQDCDIFCGGNSTADYRCGISLYNATTAITPKITQCRINQGSGGGTDLTSCVGIEVGANGKPDIFDNIISGGLGNDVSIGINAASSTSANPLIHANHIDGGNADYTIGINLDSISAVSLIYNNLLIGGKATTSGTTDVLYLNCEALIRNNTIILGLSTGTATEHGIFNDYTTAGSSIDNNIFFNSSASNDIYGIYNTNGAANFVSINNNDFTGFSNTSYHRFYHGSATDYTTITNLNALSFADSNITDNPILDPSYLLTSSSPASVTRGGIDGGANSWSFSVDKFGTTRTGSSNTGWSMGFHEYN